MCSFVPGVRLKALLKQQKCMRTEKRSTAAETILRNVGTDNTAAFAAVCFERMMQREQEMDDDFCVFYHHYNSASLLYEVQAGLGAVSRLWNLS